MTRQEAEYELQWIRAGIDEYSNLHVDPRLKKEISALDMAITALRSITREQAEKVRGEWITKHYVDGILEGTNFDECSKCGYQRVFENPELKTKYMFCPNCGAPMTDEAVDMVMERLEGMEDGKNRGI